MNQEEININFKKGKKLLDNYDENAYLRLFAKISKKIKEHEKKLVIKYVYLSLLIFCYIVEIYQLNFFTPLYLIMSTFNMILGPLLLFILSKEQRSIITLLNEIAPTFNNRNIRESIKSFKKRDKISTICIGVFFPVNFLITMNLLLYANHLTSDYIAETVFCLILFWVSYSGLTFKSKKNGFSYLIEGISTIEQSNRGDFCWEHISKSLYKMRTWIQYSSFIPPLYWKFIVEYHNLYEELTKPILNFTEIQEKKIKLTKFLIGILSLFVYFIVLLYIGIYHGIFLSIFIVIIYMIYFGYKRTRK